MPPLRMAQSFLLVIAILPYTIRHYLSTTYCISYIREILSQAIVVNARNKIKELRCSILKEYQSKVFDAPVFLFH